MKLYFTYDVMPEDGECIVYISDTEEQVNDQTSDELQDAVDELLDNSPVEVDRWVMENAHMISADDVEEFVTYLNQQNCAAMASMPPRTVA